MYSVLFPGQGSQSVGMANDLYKKFDLVKKIFSTADEVLNYNLTSLILNGPEYELKSTKNTQPAIMTVGFSIFEVLKNEFNLNLDDAKFFAGHSLGEYTALVCAGSISFEEAVFLIHERGKAMQTSTPKEEGVMLAVLGVENEELENEIKKVENLGICEIANDNCPGQIVVSGSKKSINQLQNNLKKMLKKSILLPVSAPFHCSLMEDAKNIMKPKITNCNFREPHPPIISNVTANPEKDPINIQKLLIKQITSRVRWREIIEYMIGSNITKFVEIGPGKVLSGLVKRTNKKCMIYNLTNEDEINSFVKNAKLQE